MRTFQYIVFKLLCVICASFCCGLTAAAQSDNNTWGDGTNCENDKEYCLNRRRLGYLATKHRADTLCYVYADSVYNEAVKRNDAKGRAIAISHKALKHINFSHNVDSMRIWNDSVKSFAKNHKLPRYYYFVWSQYIAALLDSDYNKYEAKSEIDKMLNEATSERYVVGQIECYRRLAHFYTYFSMLDKAYEMRVKEIQLTEQYDPNNYNISVYYAETARDCIAVDKFEEAEMYLQKGDECANTDICRVQLLKTRVDLAVRRNDIPKVLELAQKTKNIDAIEGYAHIQLIDMYYHIFTGNYYKADSVSENLYKHSYISESTHLSNKLMIAKYDTTYSYMRDNIESFYRYRHVIDSISRMKVSMLADDSNPMKLDLAVLQKENNNIKDYANSLTKHLWILLFISVVGAVVSLGYYSAKLKRKNKQLLNSEQALREEKEVAVKANEMKAEVIRNMSHEIRTPLNAVVGFTEVLSARFTSGIPEEQDLANKIRSSANDLLAIVNTTIDISDLETIAKIEKKDNIYINQFCIKLLEKYKAQKSRGVSIRFYPLNEDRQIITNERCLRIGIDAILSNAFKFTKSGYVEISIYNNHNNSLNIEVIDTGCGIPEDMIDMVFDRFFKIDQFSQGIGLGLPLCKLALSRINATISVDSMKNQQGTCAVIKLTDPCI